MTAAMVGPTAEPVPWSASGSWFGRTFRVLLGLALVAAGVAIVANADLVRGFEASASGWIAHRTTGLETFVAPERATFYWGIGSPRTYGLTVTPECSSAYLIGPLLALFGLLALRRRLPVRRVLLGLAAGAAVIFVMNLIRLAVIAFSVDTWGRGPAFWWSHVVVGSLIAIAGTIAAFALALGTAFGRRRRTAAAHDPEPGR